jgi:alanine racemase
MDEYNYPLEGANMARFYRPHWVEVNLDAIQSNVKAFREALPNNVKLMAVVKADAYGHGSVPVAQAALDAGANQLGVAFLDEALVLRRQGIDAPLLVLGYTDPEGCQEAILHDISVTVYRLEMLKPIAVAAAALGRPAKLHIKVDTGMGRLGVTSTEELLAIVAAVEEHPYLLWEGLFTHYACADEEDKAYTHQQAKRMKQFIQAIEEKGFRVPLVHSANSATGMDTPELAFDLVRLGISLYGFYPSEQVQKDRIALQPALQWKARVVHLKEVEQGTSISYGATYRAQGVERIATIPVGYADGYSRRLTGVASVLIRGQRAPIVGRICMDQLMINVTHIPEVEMGDEVVLLGRQDNEAIPAEELAAWLGTINYEIPCMINHRVPRVYTHGGQVVRIINGLERMEPRSE